ncbi:unnamed protein product, partial [Phaeothamnion confervicola]
QLLFSQTQDAGQPVLYVMQHEVATVRQRDFHIIASDRATTCHIVCVRHSSTGLTVLAHIDGDGCLSSLAAAIDDAACDADEASRAASSDDGQPGGRLDGRLEVYVVGGFEDPLAAKLNDDLFDCLRRHP